MKRLLFSTIAIALLAGTATPAAALNLNRCENLAPIVTPDTAPVDRVGQSKVAPHNGTAYTIATFCPAAAAAGTCTGESLSEPVTTYAYVTLDGLVADIDQFHDGKVDLKASAKAYAKAVLAAVLAGQPIPAPGPQFEVVNWNAPQPGSC